MTIHCCYLITALITFNACDNAKPAPVQVAVPPVAPGPPGEELLEALQGRWQSEQNPAYALDIRDGRMKHLEGDRVTGECELEAFGDCADVVCQTDSSALPGGWCFVEKENGGRVCYHVLQCDSLLRYRSAGADADTFVFKKI